MKSLVQNAASESQVKNAENKMLRGRERELRDVADLLATASGRRFIWRYLGLGGIFETSFTGNSTTFFKEGARNLALQILADVNEADPDGYLKMLKESKMENS